MLVIRMQRTGRKGHAMFRVVVQESRLTPTSGKVVALVGSYDPHAKTAQVDKDKASFYLTHGARPSPRVVRLFQAQKVKLPDWVTLPADSKKRTTRNPDKLRKNQPAAPVSEEAEAKAPAAEAVPEAAPETTENEQPVEAATETAAEPEDQPKAE
jgi:small subunit ribosomal protein S16